MRDVVISTGPVPIAARDFGGPGDPLLLLHGAGGNLGTITVLAQALAANHRVVTVDLRGHGESGDGPWSWDDALADLAAVTAKLELGSPAVVGVSLGGMLATLWAARHPDCPGAVNLDGTPPPTRVAQLSGLDSATAAADLERLHQTFTAMTEAMAGPLTAEMLDQMLGAYRDRATRYGLDEDVVVAGFRRNLITRDGNTLLRPAVELTRQLRDALQSLDLMPAYRSTKCPLLVVLADEDLAEQQQFHALYDAYRTTVLAQLTAAAEENPNLRVLPLAGTSHAMFVEVPTQLAELITEFLTAE
jgi:pimeloyl-ACP methyl ester carboxylesterase